MINSLDCRLGVREIWSELLFSDVETTETRLRRTVSAVAIWAIGETCMELDIVLVLSSRESFSLGSMLRALSLSGLLFIDPLRLCNKC